MGLLAQVQPRTAHCISARPRYLGRYFAQAAAETRAAAKAKDEAELYLLLADEIEDKDQKKTFIRKAMSVSGRE